LKTIDPNGLIFTGRGSTALRILFEIIGSEGAKVLVPANICEIVIATIYASGLQPIYYDVDAMSGNANLNHIQKIYSGKEKILIAVHNYGTPIQIIDIKSWSVKENIFLIEDVCNCLGGFIKDQPVGVLGDVSIFSFGYAKIIEYGFGGAMWINDDSLKSEAKKRIKTLDDYSSIHSDADDFYQMKLRVLRGKKLRNTNYHYTKLYKDYSDYLLYKINNEDVSNIIDMFQKLDKNIDRRRQLAGLYREGIQNPLVTHRNFVEGDIYWRYTFIIDKNLRAKAIRELINNKIPVSCWYPIVIPFFEENFDKLSFPGAKSFGEKVLNLWVDHSITLTKVRKAITIINQLA